MTRLKVHNMAEGGTSQADISAICGVPIRSVQRIVAEAVPSREEVIAGEVRDAPRRGRPPKADAAMVERIRSLLADEKNAHLNAMEVLRRAKGWGYTGGRNQMTELVKSLRPVPRKDPLVLYDGLPGEYAQFDFGEAYIDFENGGRRRVQFFAGRLKYSRMMHVVIVPDQCSETVVRSLIACLGVFGGSTLQWVFDNAKSMRISPIGVKPVILHRHLAQLVAEYGVVATFCAPRQGQQKATVERLVGFVKNSFLRQRLFIDDADLQKQLDEWLHDSNHVRPCDGTKEIPAIRLQREKQWLDQRPVQVTPDEWAMAASATVTPMGTIRLMGTSYSATDTKLGAPATIAVRKNRIDIDIRGERCTHVRADHTGGVHRLPIHRASMLAALHGQRRVSTFRRQCLLELGAPAEDFLEQLVHAEPCGRWEQPCQELFEMLRDHGDATMTAAFSRCVRQRRFTVDAVRSALAAA